MYNTGDGCNLLTEDIEASLQAWFTTRIKVIVRIQLKMMKIFRIYIPLEKDMYC